MNILLKTNLTLQRKSLLFEYMDDNTVHSTLNITFRELVLHTLSRIEINEHKEEIFNILEYPRRVDHVTLPHQFCNTVRQSTAVPTTHKHMGNYLRQVSPLH